MERDGSIHSCDHYVYPKYRLGNIREVDMGELARSPRQIAFGNAKRDALPRYCRECSVRFLCNGGCPMHRFADAPGGGPGLNYLCSGYKHFFTRTAPEMQAMAELLGRNRPPADIMGMVAERDRGQAMEAAGRNDPCPCGSGRKKKHCCGRTDEV